MDPHTSLCADLPATLALRLAGLARHAMRPRQAAACAATVLAVMQAVPSSASAATPADILAPYSREAGRSPVPAQGERFFKATHGGEWSCASCHGQLPTAVGRHASTGKRIEPLAPAAHAQRLSDPAKVEKWLRRNCKDVLSRECTAAEKADVLAWLISLKP